MVHWLFVKVNGKIQRIGLDEIHYIEADGHYIRIYTDRGIYYTLLSLNQMEEELPPGQFCRIHRSYIVAINKIEWFDHHKLEVKKKELPMAPTSYELLKSRILIVCNDEKDKEASSKIVFDINDRRKLHEGNE